MRWMTFIGGRSIVQFVAEAWQIGVSRHVNRHSKVEFGDEIYLARYCKGTFVFGMFRVTQISLNEEVAKQVKKELLKQGKTVIEGGGDPISVQRKCGEYTVSSLCSVDASLQEITAIAKEVDPELMLLIGGPLVKTMLQILDPPPKFSRGLIKCKYDFSEAEPWDGTSQLMGVEGYVRY